MLLANSLIDCLTARPSDQYPYQDFSIHDLTIFFETKCQFTNSHFHFDVNLQTHHIAAVRQLWHPIEKSITLPSVWFYSAWWLCQNVDAWFTYLGHSCRVLPRNWHGDRMSKTLSRSGIHSQNGSMQCGFSAIQTRMLSMQFTQDSCSYHLRFLLVSIVSLCTEMTRDLIHKVAIDRLLPYPITMT
jgi:hypothetical protein